MLTTNASAICLHADNISIAITIWAKFTLLSLTVMLKTQVQISESLWGKYEALRFKWTPEGRTHEVSGQRQACK